MPRSTRTLVHTLVYGNDSPSVTVDKNKLFRANVILSYFHTFILSIHVISEHLHIKALQRIRVDQWQQDRFLVQLSPPDSSSNIQWPILVISGLE